jgi:hypothetical protein
LVRGSVSVSTVSGGGMKFGIDLVFDRGVEHEQFGLRGELELVCDDDELGVAKWIAAGACSG